MNIFLGNSLLASGTLSPLLVGLGWNTILVCRECGDWARVIPFPMGGAWEARPACCPKHPHPYLGNGSILHPWRSYTVKGQPLYPEFCAWATYHPKLLRHEFNVLMSEAGFPISESGQRPVPQRPLTLPLTTKENESGYH